MVYWGWNKHPDDTLFGSIERLPFRGKMHFVPEDGKALKLKLWIRRLGISDPQGSANVVGADGIGGRYYTAEFLCADLRRKRLCYKNRHICFLNHLPYHEKMEPKQYPAILLSVNPASMSRNRIIMNSLKQLCWKRR